MPLPDVELKSPIHLTFGRPTFLGPFVSVCSSSFKMLAFSLMSCALGFIGSLLSKKVQFYLREMRRRKIVTLEEP